MLHELLNSLVQSQFPTYGRWLTALGALFALDLLCCLPFAAEAFSDRAVAEETEAAPRRRHLLFVALFALGVALWLAPLPYGALCGSALLFPLFRHFYINTRWTSIRRGGGAPGFMSHFTVRTVLLLELLRATDPAGATLRLALTAVRWDLGWIMTCAGAYKLLVGYLRRQGMEYGHVNPLWGYHFRRLSRGAPQGFTPHLLNHLGCLVELAAGVLMLLPWPTAQVLGSLAISGSFLYVGLNIRLGRLAALMVILPLCYFPNIEATALASAQPLLAAPPALLFVLRCGIWAFMLVLPLVKFMQYLNLFANRTLPEPLQGGLTRFANWAPIIIWRVFTPDVTNFYVRIYGCAEDGATLHTLVDEETYSLRGFLAPPRQVLFKLRMLHVTESIALTSVFTTRRYFPSDFGLFARKLHAYAASLQRGSGLAAPSLRFDFVAIEKVLDEDGGAGGTGGRWAYSPKVRYTVTMASGEVREERLDPAFDITAPAQHSPVREGVAPGSYVAKAPTPTPRGS